MAEIIQITCFCVDCGEGDIRPTKITVGRVAGSGQSVNLFFKCPCCKNELVDVYTWKGVYFAGDIEGQADG